MSTTSEQLNTGQQSISRYETAKTFLWDNRYINGSYTNDGYVDVTLAEGTLMGRVAATQKIVPLQSDAVDGSQFPLGVLNKTTTVADGETVTLAVCVSGDVSEEKIVLTKVGDTLSTVISSKSIRDRIGSDTVGIKLVSATENTAYDNE